MVKLGESRNPPVISDFCPMIKTVVAKSLDPDQAGQNRFWSDCVLIDILIHNSIPGRFFEKKKSAG